MVRRNSWRPRCGAAALIAFGCASTALADDRRQVIPNDIPTQVVEVQPTNQTALGFAAQNGDGDFTKLFRDAGDAQVSSALEDLNEDGRPEIITVLAGTNTCGARDCEVVILTQAGAGYKTVFDSYASSIALGAKAATGWRDLITNFTASADGVKSGVIWTWTGERYELK